MKTRPLVIAGASRSGTSVLAQMMSRHAHVRGLGELHFFDRFRAETLLEDMLTRAAAETIADRLLHHALDGFYRPHNQADHTQTAMQIVDSLQEPMDAADVYRGVLQYCGGGYAWVIDKTPRYVSWIPEILLTLPDALVVVIVRDPRDVLLSQKYWHRALWEARAEVTRRIALRHFLQYHPLTMSLLWRSAARADRLATDRRVIHMRFEHLVADPRGAIAPLLAAMSLELEDRMLDVLRSGSSNRPGLRPETGLDPSVIGRWRDQLSSTEQWLSNQICGPLMRRYGYTPEVARPTIWGLWWTAITLPLRGAITLLMNIGRSRNVLRSASRRLL